MFFNSSYMKIILLKKMYIDISMCSMEQMNKISCQIYCQATDYLKSFLIFLLCGH